MGPVAVEGGGGWWRKERYGILARVGRALGRVEKLHIRWFLMYRYPSLGFMSPRAGPR